MTDLSQRLLADHGGLRGLLRLDVVELARIWGLDDASIRSLLPASASTPLHQAQVRTASITFHERGCGEDGHVEEPGALQERPILLSGSLLAAEVDQDRHIKQPDCVEDIARRRVRAGLCRRLIGLNGVGDGGIVPVKLPPCSPPRVSRPL